MSGNAYEIFGDKNRVANASLKKTVSELLLFGFLSRFLDASALSLLVEASTHLFDGAALNISNVPASILQLSVFTYLP